MQRLASLLLLLTVCASVAEARQQQLRGQVVNRDGVAQECQVDFYLGRDLAYRLTSDRQGYFYLNNPKFGDYRVIVVQGSRRNEFKRVAIDANGLHPPTLVVPW
jgi:hypothetical protein